MASIYPRKDSKELWIACYPQAGGPLVRTSLGTADQRQADRIREKVEILITLERMSEVTVPEKLLACFQTNVDRTGPASDLPHAQPAKSARPAPRKEHVKDAVRAYLVRCAASNVRQAVADKISRLRQFFGSTLLDDVDPRPAGHRRHAGKRDRIPPILEIIQ